VATAAERPRLEVLCRVDAELGAAFSDSHGQHEQTTLARWSKLIRKFSALSGCRGEFLVQWLEEVFERALKLGLMKDFGFCLRGNSSYGGARYGGCQLLSKGVRMHRVAPVDHD
jgi:hypothetical protein